jgi:hypothetical protein
MSNIYLEPVMPDEVPVARPIEAFVPPFVRPPGQNLEQDNTFDAYIETLRLRHQALEIARHTVEEAARQRYEIALANYHEELKEYQNNQAILAQQQAASAKAASDAATEKRRGACNATQPPLAPPPAPKTAIMGEKN